MPTQVPIATSPILALGGLEELGASDVASAVNRLLPVFLFAVACSTPGTPPPANAAAAGGDMRVQVVRLENAQADAVAKALASTLARRPAGDGGCRVVAQPDQNALVLAGTTEQIKEALDVVAKLDSRPAR